MFYNSTEDYDSCLRVVKNDEYRKVVEKDSKILMVVVKYTDPTQSTFDELYGTYSKPEVIALGYKIVE